LLPGRNGTLWRGDLRAQRSIRRKSLSQMSHARHLRATACRPHRPPGRWRDPRFSGRARAVNAPAASRPNQGRKCAMGLRHLALGLAVATAASAASPYNETYVYQDHRSDRLSPCERVSTCYLASGHASFPNHSMGTPDVSRAVMVNCEVLDARLRSFGTIEFPCLKRKFVFLSSHQVIWVFAVLRFFARPAGSPCSPFRRHRSKSRRLTG